MRFVLSRDFISFASKCRGGAYVSGSFLRRFPRVFMVGSVSGDCKMPNLHLNVLYDSGISTVTGVGGRIDV